MTAPRSPNTLRRLAGQRATLWAGTMHWFEASALGGERPCDPGFGRTLPDSQKTRFFRRPFPRRVQARDASVVAEQWHWNPNHGASAGLVSSQDGRAVGTAGAPVVNVLVWPSMEYRGSIWRGGGVEFGRHRARSVAGPARQSRRPGFTRLLGDHDTKGSRSSIRQWQGGARC